MIYTKTSFISFDVMYIEPVHVIRINFLFQYLISCFALFDPILVCSVICFEEKTTKVWHLLKFSFLCILIL